jgi:DNA polymerase III epsilon subunit family exonuclease
VECANDSSGVEGRYEALARRAYDFVVEQPGGAPEDMLVAHVFGTDAAPALWRGLLRMVLAEDQRLTLGADGVWRVPAPEIAGDFPAEFVVVDVETTGLKARHHRITEIAIIGVASDGSKSVWTSLVNPERGIPRQISRLTGIDNQLVANAPRFCSVAPTVIDLIGGQLVVGHNVEFDLGFLNAELRRCGLPTLVNQTLDTLALADALVPDLRRLALADVSRELGVEHATAHRASADAAAALGVLTALRGIASVRGDSSFATLSHLAAARRALRWSHRKVSRGRSILDASHRDGLPQAPGVYIMRDRDERVIYVGKAKNLRKRVSSYYSQPLGYTRKMDGLLESIETIEVETTGSELEALVLESQLIRRYRPRFNSQQRNVEQYVFIKVDTLNPWPTVTLSKDRHDDDARYFGPFKGERHAREAVHLINDVLPLRTCRRSFKDSRSLGSPCIELSLHRCLGPCIGKAEPDEYAGFVKEVIAFLNGDKSRLLPLLHARLERAADVQDFERAGKLRDQIRRLERLTLEQAHLDIVAKAGHLLIVLPGRNATPRHVWYLVNGVRWAALDVPDGECVETLAERLGSVRIRSERSRSMLAMSHHTVDEASIIARWVRKYTPASGVIEWEPGVAPREIAELVLAAEPLNPDEGSPDREEGDEDDRSD